MDIRFTEGTDTRSEIAARDAGATVLQAMVAIAVVVLIAYSVSPAIARFVESDKAASCQSRQRSIAEAVATARTYANIGQSVGYYDSPLVVGSPWGGVLIPQYLSAAPTCPSTGSPYNMSPVGRLWSDRGAGQYAWVNQGTKFDHRLGE